MRLAGLALAGAIGAALIPSRALERTPTICLFRRLTGRACPSCGLTRSWNAATRLQLRRSFELHPFGPLGVPIVLWWMSRHSAGRGRAQEASLVPVMLIGVAWLALWLRRLRGAEQATG